MEDKTSCRVSRLERQEGLPGWLTGLLAVGILFATANAAASQAPDLSADAWSSIQEQIEKARYQFVWTEHAALPDPGAAWTAPNGAHVLRVYFTNSGLRVLQRGEPEASWHWGMELMTWGREGDLRPLAPAKPIVDENRVEYRRGPVTEWYVNDRRGVEQGFTLEAPPPGPPRDRVALELSLSGSLIPKIDESCKVMTLYDGEGATRLRYGGLRAFDSEGRELATRLALRDSSLRDGQSQLTILVDAARAVYPVTIDPLITTEVAKLVASDGAAGDFLGTTVGIDGDTLVVGAHRHDAAFEDSGAAYVFARNQGGADGWGEVRKLTASDGAAGDMFGYSVAISGDTVIVCAIQDVHSSGAKTGAAYVFERNQGGMNNWGEVRKLTASDASYWDQFGQNVAISGDTVVVGAPLNDDGPADSGSAYVFGRNQGGADNWGEVRRITAMDAAMADHFGGFVAISGDTVVVGSILDDDGGDQSGSVYVFERNQDGPDNWGEVRKLTASDAGVNHWFGYSVTISGDTLVAGSIADAAYVFERNQGGADNWGEVRKLTGSAFEQFGQSVAVSGDTLVVGAEQDNEMGNNAGAAYVFERNRGGADNWGESRKLVASDAAESDRFGSSVAISGDTVLIGAHADDHAGAASGSAYVFVGADCDWVERAKAVASDGATMDFFGWSVAISGDTLVVGAWRHDAAFVDSGAAYVFARNQGGADGWGEVRKLVASDAAETDYFGWSVAISGDTVVVGALHAGYLQAGAAYVFERNHGGADNWGEVREITGSDTNMGDSFGVSVAISGDTVVVGGFLNNEGGPDSGSAYVFERNQGGADNWGEVHRITATDAAASDHFAEFVSISGDTVVVGSILDDDGGDESGSVYVFERNQGGADNWGEVRKLTAFDAGVRSFGYSVAISGDTLVAGSTSDSAYVFERNQGGADNWGEVRKLTGSAFEKFGQSVALSGDTLVLGAEQDDETGNNAGAAYVFERNQGGADQWGESRKLVASDAAEGDRLGKSVAVSGDTVLIGAHADDHAGATSGSAYVFVIFSDLPDEVQSLTVEGKNLTTLSWVDQGSEIRYDVAGGRISDLHADGGVTGAECLENDASFAHVDSRVNPAPGEGYYYIVRAQYACTGTYGYASSDTERLPLNDCP